MSRQLRQHSRPVRTSALVLWVACVSACGGPAPDSGRGAVQPAYDKTTGKLKELTYDSNGNGRMDTWTDMEGATPLRSRIDADEDGRIDRWEYYDAAGTLVKVGFSRKGDGSPDAWAYASGDGKLERIEISSTGDEQKIDRWEYYDPSSAGPDGRGALVRAEEDTTGDGRPDKWESYESGAIKTVAFDESGNGRPDRRLTYQTGGRLLLESQPDASGRFTRSLEVQ